ncbi:MAG TPA: SDR family NAD(P)-dependent oxidoreductase, partial [Chitinophagales bacterium]|nr:SDR family NAD(P)-dependent oxidoreductase [Chitinophagales bacterium]
SLDDWENMIDTNVKGLLFLSRQIVPTMVTRKLGHVINIGSTAGKYVYEKGNVYNATKFAVNALSQAMRIDLLRHNIRVTAVHPGAAETEFSNVRFKGDDEKATNVYKGFQPLAANDVADVVLYCAMLPQHVCVNDIVVTPTAQANPYYLNRQ